MADLAEPTSARISRAWVAKIWPAGVRVAGRRARSISCDTEFPLESGDVRAHPGLGAMDLGGRCGETTSINHSEKRLEPVQLHPDILRTAARDSPQWYTLGLCFAHPRSGNVHPCRG